MIGNVSDKIIKRVRLKLVKGIDRNGEFIYSESYDLFDERDIEQLMKAINYLSDDTEIGFVIDGSCFKDNEYDNKKLGENEFNPIKEYYIGREINKTIELKNDALPKSEYIEVVSNYDELKNKINNLVYEIKLDNSLENISKIFNMDEQHDKVYAYN